MVLDHGMMDDLRDNLQSSTKVLSTPGSDNWNMRRQVILEAVTNGITGIRNPFTPIMLETSNDEFITIYSIELRGGGRTDKISLTDTAKVGKRAKTFVEDCKLACFQAGQITKKGQ